MPAPGRPQAATSMASVRERTPSQRSSMLKLTPVDQDRLDLEEAFITVTEPLDRGMLKVRVGRQQMGFDLQRFISVRDGPNVRQSYDAVWVDYERGLWRFISFYSHPVQIRPHCSVRKFNAAAPHSGQTLNVRYPPARTGARRHGQPPCRHATLHRQG